MQIKLTAYSYARINEYYNSMVAGGPTFAMLTYNTNASYIMPMCQAIAALELFKDAQPVAAHYNIYRDEPFKLPTLRVLTAYEHRCQWLATYFNVSVSDVQEYCKYDPSIEINRQYKLDFTPPELESPALDQDLKG